MADFAPQVVSFLSILTIVGQVLSLVLIILFLTSRGAALSGIARHGLTLMLIVATTATLGSLFFSEIAQWTPCKLCWLQRIFMYPQAVLLILALYKRDRGIAPYILALSLIGIFISGMHYTEQVLAALQPPADPAVPCDTTGVSCASTPFFHFGYITIPMMAFTAFLLNALGSFSVMRSR